MKSITITKDDFMTATTKAIARWNEVGREIATEHDDPMQSIMMNLQNTLFGALLATILFDEEEEI